MSLDLSYLPDPSPNANTFGAVWFGQSQNTSRYSGSLKVRNRLWYCDWLEMNPSMITLFCKRPLITTNNFNDGSLRLKYVANNRAAESFSVSRQASTPTLRDFIKTGPDYLQCFGQISGVLMDSPLWELMLWLQGPRPHFPLSESMPKTTVTSHG